MTSLKSKLQLALLNRKKGRNLIEKGFTLVELMIVIVIVGILSSVALPNFLSQSNKAKGTEAKTQATSLIKTAASLYSDGGLNLIERDLLDASGNTAIPAGGDICTGLGGPANTVALFDYLCDPSDDIGGSGQDGLIVLATANDNAGGVTDNTLEMNINFETGVVTTNRANTAQMFGGTKTDV